jgi:hypothetical protein
MTKTKPLIVDFAQCKLCRSVLQKSTKTCAEFVLVLSVSFSVQYQKN